jgi:cell division protein FtsX
VPIVPGKEAGKLNYLLRPSLKGLFRIGFVDFYAFLIVAVALIMRAPQHVMVLLGSVLAVIFVLSSISTILGMIFNRLYQEPETYSILVLQVAFSILFIVLLT